MAATSWKSGGTLRMTSTGTLVGMPALRSGLDAYHPERWSCPPEPGTNPIIPCDDVDDEVTNAPWRSLQAAAPLPERTPLPRLPTRRVMPADERRLLQRCAVIALVALPAVVLVLWWSAGR